MRVAGQNHGGMASQFPPTDGPASARILIVDDELDSLSLIVGALEKAGFEACFADGGEAALRLMQRNLYDLVILDIAMPGMDGFEVLKRARGLEGYDAVPVIFLTARTGEQTAGEAFAAGGADYMTKPCRAKELLARITHHLEEGRKRRRIEALMVDAARQMETAAERLKREVLEKS